MKKLVYTVCALLMTSQVFAQEETGNNEPDTTRIKVGGKEIIVISPAEFKVEDGSEEGDTLDAEWDEDVNGPTYEPHWSAFSFGPTILLNTSNKASFPLDKQWENDPANSFAFEFNFLEHKFPIYKNHIGFSTGLGINWMQIGLQQYQLNVADSLWATVDTTVTYKKNKLRAIYLTAPLMLEICSKDSGSEGFYLAAGVIGGVRIASTVKTVIGADGKDIKQKERARFGLEAFKLDATVRLGYNDWGVYANYGVIPMFDTDKTAEVHPVTIGLTYNF